MAHFRISPHNPVLKVKVPNNEDSIGLGDTKQFFPEPEFNAKSRNAPERAARRRLKPGAYALKRSITSGTRAR